jgi:Ti-type conjugative transfer relaxase TraA
MLSISRSSTKNKAVSYFPDGKALEDYYADSKPGRIIGRAAQYLGLADSLDTETFHRLLDGFHPQTGESMCRNAGEANRVAGWDFTFSAPKSVSVLWAQLQEEGRAEIEVAMADATKVALEHLQQYAAIGRRSEHERSTCDWVAATFQHDSSREGDPQLHTHCYVFNLGRCEDGQWSTLDTREAFRWKKAAGAIFRAALAEQVKLLGYEVEAEPDRPQFFQIVGVDHDVCDKFSKRRAQILTAHKNSKLNTASAKALECVALASRKSKEKRVRDELLLEWQAVGEASGFGPREAEELHRLAKSIKHAHFANEPTDETICELLTESESTFTTRDVWEWVANTEAGAGRGYTSIAERVDRLMQSREITPVAELNSGDVLYSTRSMIKLEREYSDLAARQKGNQVHCLKQETVDEALANFADIKGFQLSDEQVTAVRHMTQAEGSVVAIRGGAGTGKSTTLEASRLAWEASGYRVRGAALSGKAADGLEQSANIESRTLHALLQEATVPNRQGILAAPFHANDVIVVDEAGMLDSRLMHQLLTTAHSTGAKVVLVGDEKQVQAIRAGGAFKAVQKVVGCVELTEIHRQRDNEYRQAVNNLVDGQAAEALAHFIRHKAIHVSSPDTPASEKMAAALVADLDAFPPSQVLGITNTNSQARAVNDAVRAALQALGRLPNGIPVAIRDRDGRSAGIREFAHGDRVLFTKNCYRLGVRNGSTGTVERTGVGPGGVVLHIALDKGRRLAVALDQYSNLEHGYAVTTHKAQGMTVERSHVLLGGNMQNRESSYVQISRAKDSTQIYLDAAVIDRLATSVEATPSERMLAYAQQMAESAGSKLPALCRHDFSACRDWLNENTTDQIHRDEVQVQLDDLANVVEAMTRSVQKGTTLDYPALALPLSEKADVLSAHRDQDTNLAEIEDEAEA